MKQVSASLSQHLSQETTTLARLWKITRADGSVKGYTDFDQDIVFADDGGAGSPTPDLTVQTLTNAATGFTQSSQTITPQNSSDLLIFVTNYPYATSVSGWADSQGFFYKTSSGTSPITLSTDAGAYDAWANVIASFTALGTPTLVQHFGLVGGAWSAGAVFESVSGATAAGNRLIVTVQSTTLATSTTAPIVTDSFGNDYTMYGTTQYNSTETSGYTAACWLYEAVNKLSGTMTVTATATSFQSSAIIAFYEYSGIAPATPPAPTGTTYTSLEGFTASAVQHGSDGSADNLTITGFLSDSGIIEADVRAHLYDAATVEMRIVNWADLSQGALKLIKGTVGDITLNNGAYELELRGLTQLLSTQIGDTFSPLCRAELFGGGAENIDPQNHWKCRLNRADWVQSGTVASSPNSTTIVPTTSGSPPVGLLMKGSSTPTDPAPDGWFNDGVITFLGGQLGGYSFEISSWDGSQLFLFGGAPMPFSPAPGDAFEIEPGCDKSMPTCSGKFNNGINHAAESAIPGLFQIGAMSNTQVG